MENCELCDEEFEANKLTQYKGEMLCEACLDFVIEEEEEEE